MTDQPTGRALAEAAARAMGWRIGFDDRATEGDIYDAEGKWRGATDEDACFECGRSKTGWPTEREMLAWLHERGIVHAASSRVVCEVRFMSLPGMDFVPGEDERPSHKSGPTLRDALMRLVVAVAEREANNGS